VLWCWVLVAGIPDLDQDALSAEASQSRTSSPPLAWSKPTIW
jgi:hypothetical protein